MKSQILSLAACLILFISACSTNRASETQNADTATIQTADVTYTCPMHPEVISDKAGKCPKCKMDLVKKEQEAPEDHSGHQH